MEGLVAQATADSLVSADWGLIMDVCDRVSSDATG
jgi:hypothetical protein